MDPVEGRVDDGEVSVFEEESGLRSHSRSSGEGGRGVLLVSGGETG